MTGEEVGYLRKYIKDNIFHKVKFNDFPTEQNELHNILRRTIACRESDSVLVVGPRGCGKSYIIEECIKQLNREFTLEHYKIVRLNGLVHTDDSLALRAIIEQIHVDVLEGEQISSSFADNLQFVLESFRNGDTDSTKAVIFILDEFQLFCNHRNQTLLYNLFDQSKSSKSPLCVVGETCRYDITELLEKRVSSRFSHRQILLMPNSSLEARVEEFLQYFKIEKRPSSRITNKYIDDWNENIKSLTNIPNVVQRLRRQLEIDPSRRAFRNSAFQLSCKISEKNNFLSFENIEEVFRKYYVDDKVEYLKDLSVLELCLVISMCHHDEIYDGEPFNFEMVLEKYLKFAKRNSAVQITQKPILLKAFERIKELEFIMPITNSTRNQKKEYILYNSMVTKNQVKSAINSYIGLPTDVVQWAFSNVV